MTAPASSPAPHPAGRASSALTGRVLIISPVRNEAAHIERVARALAAQELRPARWIVVDDGSSDDTLTLLRTLEREIDFMTVIEAPPRAELRNARDRLARAAAPVTFNAGLATVDWRDYTHVMKLDGDIELPPHYLRELLERFAADERLGLAGGVLDEPTEDGGRRRIRIPAVHVHGALKCYTRACFEAIGGIQERLGWDTIDGAYARMHGFRTRSFDDLVSLHHRPLGSADGTVRGHARHGRCAYIAHYTPSWVLLRSLKVASRRPYGLSGLAFAAGYGAAAARRIERVPDPDFRRFTQRELRQRMLSTLHRSGRTRARVLYVDGRRVLSNALVERRWGTETGRVADLAELGVDAPGRVRYEPSGWLDLRRVLRARDVTPDDVFLDLGSGKGRVVLQAAAYPFRRVIGVELSPELQEVAAANVAARRESLRCRDVELVTADATQFVVPDDVTVVYLYNPFRGEVFASVVERLLESLDRAPRPLRVIYRTPLEEETLLRSGRFKLIRSARGFRPGRAWSEKMSIRIYAAR